MYWISYNDDYKIDIRIIKKKILNHPKVIDNINNFA